MTKPRFSARARRHAAESKQRTRRMLEGAAARSGEVHVSYLPGFKSAGTRFPFAATINGEPAIVRRVAGRIVIQRGEL